MLHLWAIETAAEESSFGRQVSSILFLRALCTSTDDTFVAQLAHLPVSHSLLEVVNFVQTYYTRDNAIKTFERRGAQSVKGKMILFFCD